MIGSFGDRATEEIFDGADSKAARRRLPLELHALAREKLDLLNRAEELNDLRLYPGNRLKKLSGARAGEWAIRINEQYRICFRWQAGQAEDVEITDYH